MNRELDECEGQLLVGVGDEEAGVGREVFMAEGVREEGVDIARLWNTLFFHAPG